MLIQSIMGGGGGKNVFYKTYDNCPQIIDVGFTPKYVLMTVRYATSHNMTFIYDADISTTTHIRRYDTNETQNVSQPVASNVAGFIKVGSDSEIEMNLYGNMTSVFVMATD